MRIVATTNDPVRLSYLTSLLSGAGIETLVLDMHASVIEGSAGAIQRRLAVADRDEHRANQVLAQAVEL